MRQCNCDINSIPFQPLAVRINKSCYRCCRQQPRRDHRGPTVGRDDGIQTCRDEADLERPLEDSDRKAADGFGGQPEPEVRMRLGQLFQVLFQLAQPFDEQMAVLQHQPLSTVDGVVQKLDRQLTDSTQRTVTSNRGS